MITPSKQPTQVRIKTTKKFGMTQMKFGIPQMIKTTQLGQKNIDKALSLLKSGGTNVRGGGPFICRRAQGT
jgi:hypothetical protein